MSDVADPNLRPRMLWTPVFPRRILSDSPGQRRPDLLGPEVSVFFFSASDTHSRTGRESSSYKTREREREREMAPVSFPLLTGTLQHSLSQSPWGDNIKQRKKPFTFYCLLPQRAHISFSLCLSSFSWTSHIFLPLILPLVSVARCFCVLKKFDKSTTQHKKHTKMKIKAETQKPQSRRHFETVRDHLYDAEEKDHTSRRTSRPHPERTRMYRIKKYSTNYIHIISIGWYSLGLL